MYEGNRYQDGYSKAFRNLSGLVLPMLVTVHNELHAETFQPIKPCKLLMVDIIQYGNQLDLPVYDRFQAIVGRFEHLAEHSTHLRMSDEAGRIAANLRIQDEYISQGIVVPRMLEAA